MVLSVFKLRSRKPSKRITYRRGETALQQTPNQSDYPRASFFSSRITEKTKPANMPVSRMRMRPWLEKMIESNSIPGLTWVDKDRKIFSIPWKHAARHGWELDKDASLFKEWAIHTGKYSQGQTCDPKTWKANFRCAMNSLPDIEEVKDRSINKGQQAMRVFRMLPAAPKGRDKRSKVRETKSRKKSQSVKIKEDPDYSDTVSPMSVPASLPEETMSTQENRVDSTVQMDQDFPFVTPSEVPDWSLSVEIGPDTLSHSFPHRFEVSPDHSSDYDYPQDIIEICQQLEKDSQWMYNSDCKGFLSNEACTSPGSQWSESSSEEVDDIPQYTTLGTDFTNSTDDFWNSFCQQIPPL
ncbi:interferon regulatory factor 1b isoform X2 [Kryptolebias marmoratus]|uniref:interferon regulatory factor 1b isoform X2 n=1 Tax=Kryptolebias marmoratus TaxID=37003 RepID=UPI0018ACDA7E|nr:interferon regulatory factor 1b isoform X2 [Kryptolebias marmoratus]